MPFFRRERKQDEENLEWLYRNLQELDENAEGQAEQPTGEEDESRAVDAAPPDTPPATDLSGTEAPRADVPGPANAEAAPPAQQRHPENNRSDDDRPVGARADSNRPEIHETPERRENQMSTNRREEVPFPNLTQQAPPPAARPERREQPATTAETVVGRQANFTGTFRSESDLRIEGTFEGEIDCRGTVTVAEDATMSATVRARNIVIAGSANGDIAVEERLHLRTSGELRGKSQAATFVVEEGAYFEGEMKMGSANQDGWQNVSNGMSSERLGSTVEANALANDDLWEPTEQA